MYEKFFKKVEEANKIAVFMHIKPDGDCIGSALSLYAYLTKLGKTVHVFLEPIFSLKECFLFLPFADKVNSERLNKAYDLGIAVDCGDESMVGRRNIELFYSCKEQFLIDHHELGTPFVDEFIIEPRKASNTMILFKMFEEFDKSLIDRDIATLLFAGLITDSGALTYSNVNEETYEVAARLCKYGIDSFGITTKVFKDTKLNAFKLSNRVLSLAEFFYDNRVGIIKITAEDYKATGTTNEDTSGIINRLFDVIDIRLAISISELTKDCYQISFRSKNGVNAGRCANYFGGGGHFYASGCRISAGIDEVYKMIHEMIEVTQCLTVS